MTRILLATIFAVGVSAPAFAQSEGGMSCEDFMAMDSEGQMQAMETASAEGSSGDHGDSESASGSGEQMSADEMTQMAASACEENPDMMVGEAMQSMEEDG